MVYGDGSVNTVVERETSKESDSELARGNVALVENFLWIVALERVVVGKVSSH